MALKTHIVLTACVVSMLTALTVGFHPNSMAGRTGSSSPSEMGTALRTSYDDGRDFPDSRGYGDGGGGSKDDQSVMMSSLSQRIQEIQDEENLQAERQLRELSTRMQIMQESESILELLESTIVSDGDVDPQRRLVQLPVVCFDALLPKQEMEGRAEDPLFCEFLRDQVGIGGWFVMTSLNYFTRTVRRHGTVVKLVGMDAPNAGSNEKIGRVPRVPTAVDFSLVGHSRCRVVGPREEMKHRIGRWRRAYDPNGEEMMLGWGEERFTDALHDTTAMISADDIEPETEPLANNNRRSRKVWTDCWIEVNLEQSEQNEEALSDDALAIQERLPEMVDEWYSLASNIATYENTNVTASTRIKKGAPGLWVEPKKLLQRVTNQLGPRPSITEDPTAFCFWVAALINPLPVLGVSLEIRGKLLEAPTIEKRLKIVEMGLRRSIDNLTGKAPL